MLSKAYSCSRLVVVVVSWTYITALIPVVRVVADHVLLGGRVVAPPGLRVNSILFELLVLILLKLLSVLDRLRRYPLQVQSILL